MSLPWEAKALDGLELPKPARWEGLLLVVVFLFWPERIDVSVRFRRCFTLFLVLLCVLDIMLISVTLWITIGKALKYLWK